MQDRSPLTRRRLLQRTAGPYIGSATAASTVDPEAKSADGKAERVGGAASCAKGFVAVARTFSFALRTAVGEKGMKLGSGAIGSLRYRQGYPGASAAAPRAVVRFEL